MPYLFTHEDKAERERLAAIEAAANPFTIECLEKIAVGEGWRCLEIGAGAGSIAEWLCRRVGPNGKVVATDTIYPHEPRRQWDEALASLARLCRVHGVELVAIGNGTASRETDKLAGELVARHPELKLTKVMVSEAGASVYSASAFASQELPGLDVSLRGAVSIARRLQDPLAELVKLANPLSSAKFVRFETFHDPSVASGQTQTWYPWPYVEGITMAEATNELALLVTGAYGKPLPKQMGAPMRLHLPWKYGFKSIKSIKRITFTDRRPVSFWESFQGQEYGFWANVNPQVPHARWSQATERVLGTDERIPTELYNGYGEWVAHLYKDITGERLFT